AFRNVAGEANIACKPEREQAFDKRALGRNLLAPDAVTTLAVEHLARFERALCGGSDVGAKAGGCSGRLLAQSGACDGDAELEPDHVDRPVERAVVSAAVGQHGIFGKTAPRIVALAFEYDVSTERKMMGNVPPVAIDRRDDFRHAGFLQSPSSRF